MKTLSPLIERIEAEIMGRDLLHADDTPIRGWTGHCATRGLAKASDKAGCIPHESCETGPVARYEAMNRDQISSATQFPSWRDERTQASTKTSPANPSAVPA